jgi:hypothetical protein
MYVSVIIPPQAVYHADVISELLQINLQQFTDQFPIDITILAGELNRLSHFDLLANQLIWI